MILRTSSRSRSNHALLLACYGRIALLTLASLTPLLGQTKAAPKPTGSLSGIIRDESGKATAALVIVSTYGFEQRASSRSDGTFEFKTLRSGKYILCAAPANSLDSKDDPFVDSCLWQDENNPRITVGAGQSVSNIILPVDHGYLLKVRVNDPGRRLGNTNGNNGKSDTRDDFVIHVKGPKGLAQSIPLTASDANGRDHTLVVPLNTPHTVSIFSRSYVAKDNNGRDVDQAQTLQSSAVSRGQKGSDIVLTVDRAKP